jgi:hypothetical protein
LYLTVRNLVQTFKFVLNHTGAALRCRSILVAALVLWIQLAKNFGSGAVSSHVIFPRFFEEKINIFLEVFIKLSWFSNHYL